MKLFAIVLTIFLFSVTSHAKEFSLNCEGISGNEKETVGKIGDVRVKNKNLNITDVSVQINSNTCVFDWGNIKGEFPLRNITENEIVCGKKKDINSKHSDKDISLWHMVINRLNGKLTYIHMTDYLADNWMSYRESKQVFKCKKASKLF